LANTADELLLGARAAQDTYLIGVLQFAASSHQRQNLEQSKHDLAVAQHRREGRQDVLGEHQG
jgi:hypothetical protein